MSSSLPEGPGLFGKKGEAYVALASREPLRSGDTHSFQVIADADSNVWVVQLGSTEEFRNFDHFIEAVASARLEFGQTTVFQSPTEGLVEVGWKGPMLVNGTPIQLGPYPRWSNRYGHTPFGSQSVIIEHQEKRLVLDVRRGLRTLLQRNESGTNNK